MATPTVGVEEAKEIQQLAMGRSRQQAQHVTILRPVDAPAPHVDQPLTIVDGATADPLPDGRSAVAVDRGPRVAMDAGVLEPTFGDTTEDTDYLKDSAAGEQTPELAEDADPLAHEVEPPELAEDADPLAHEVEPPELAEDADPLAHEVEPPELAEDADPLAHEVEPPSLDFGWGIVVGELTGDDFTEILSMPKL